MRWIASVSLLSLVACRAHDVDPRSASIAAHGEAPLSRAERFEQLMDDLCAVLDAEENRSVGHTLSLASSARPELLPGGAELPARARVLFAEDPSDETAFQLILALHGWPLTHWLDERAVHAALERHHLDRANVSALIEVLDPLMQPQDEALLQRLAVEHTDPDVRGRALFALAEARLETSRLHATVVGCPNERDVRQARELLGDARVDELLALDPARAEREAETMFERIVDEYPDVPFWSDEPGGETLGDAAQAPLFEIRRLASGQPVPEIDGRDLAGKPMKLSDLRGKVVLLQFWTPSDVDLREHVAPANALHARLRGEPFEVVGVACATGGALARRASERHGIAWRSFADNPPGALNAQWSVDLRPRRYLIDADGIIRARDLCGEKLDAAVDELVAQAKRR